MKTVLAIVFLIGCALVQFSATAATKITTVRTTVKQPTSAGGVTISGSKAFICQQSNANWCLISEQEFVGVRKFAGANGVAVHSNYSAAWALSFDQVAQMVGGPKATVKSVTIMPGLRENWTLAVIEWD